MMERVNSITIYYKNFCKCHNVPPVQQYNDNKKFKKKERNTQVLDEKRKIKAREQTTCWCHGVPLGLQPKCRLQGLRQGLEHPPQHRSSGLGTRQSESSKRITYIELGASEIHCLLKGYRITLSTGSVKQPGYSILALCLSLNQVNKKTSMNNQKSISYKCEVRLTTCGYRKPKLRNYHKNWSGDWKILGS
jgi:hypothetical protein